MVKRVKPVTLKDLPIWPDADWGHWKSELPVRVGLDAGWPTDDPVYKCRACKHKFGGTKEPIHYLIVHAGPGVPPAAHGVHWWFCVNCVRRNGIVW